MSTYTVISRQAQVYDARGYLQQSGVQVCDHGDTISIGATEHPKDNLEISAERIVSRTHGWEVVL